VYNCRNKTESPVNTTIPEKCVSEDGRCRVKCGYRRQVIRRDISIVASFNCLQAPVAAVATVFLISVGTVLAIIIIILLLLLLSLQTTDTRLLILFFRSILIVQRLPAEKLMFGRIQKRQEFRIGSH